MCGRGLDRMLTGTALALVLTLGSAAAVKAVEPLSPVEALIPMPEPADLAPPTIADIGGPATGTTDQAAIQSAPPAAGVSPETDATTTAKVAPDAPLVIDGIPVPEPANVPPPSLADIQGPALADAPVADKLRSLIPGKIERLVDRKKDRAAIEAFYAARSFAPIWIENGAPSARAYAAIARLKAADTDGLDPTDYPTPDFKAAADKPEALAEADLRLSMAVLAYARHAQTGRVHFSRISKDIYYEQAMPDPAEILARMAEAKDAAAALDAYNPPHQGYKALKAKLAEARGRNGDSAPARIAPGPVLKVGMQDARVPLLRERLGISGDADNTTYDKALGEAVKKFQRKHELSATGKLSSATVETLNGPRRDRDADIIIANMERWRWLPRDLGKAHVMVNIPEYTLKVVHDGAIVWRTKIVVGKPSMPTPLISETMKYITVNPTWNVPPSIVQNEYLPVLAQDPTALERVGLRVIQNRDGSVHIYQPPGDGNALGRIRFNFPNKFLVYQHDTPQKHLFAQDKRAYSHGCMRVQDPLKYGEVLLSIAAPKEGYTAERLRRMFGSAEQNINFRTPIPVHLTYQTAYVDEAGKLVIREDVYGRDARILAALKGDERRFADIAIERHDTSPVRHQAIRLPPRQENNGLSFFERLFR